MKLCHIEYRDFVVWTKESWVSQRIYANDDFINDTITKTVGFIRLGILPKLVGRWYTRQSFESDQTSTTTTQPLPIAAQPSSTTTQPLSTTTQPLSTATQPSSTATQPSSTATQPLSTATQPLFTATQPSSTIVYHHSGSILSTIIRQI